MTDDQLQTPTNLGDDPADPTTEDVPFEYHLRVYTDRSKLITESGSEKIFTEGPNNPATKQRYKKINDALAQGFLREQIRLCREEPEELVLNRVTEVHQQLIDGLVDGMTSEVGRALVGLVVLQMTIKAIEPAQNIRLHKGGSSARTFGWKDGISMRSLDSAYITPVLRDEGLLKLRSCPIFERWRSRLVLNRRIGAF